MAHGTAQATGAAQRRRSPAACGTCGTALSGGERFCPACGAALAGPPPARRRWALPAAIVALVAAAGGAVAALAVRGSDDAVSTTAPTQTTRRIEAVPAPPQEETTPASETPTATAGTATDTSQYAQTCSIKAWYSSYLPGGSYIHFKCVDESKGTTVEEALGSDNIDLSDEAEQARETPKRSELVDQLTRKLEAAGWQQIGAVDGGEWYQLRFGR